MSSADGHVDHPDLVLHLPDHDSGFARVRGHPVEHAGGRTHRISTVKLHACCRASHRECDVAGKHSVLHVAHRNRECKRLEVLGGIVVTEAGNFEVLRDNLATLSHELFGKNLRKRLKTYSHHLQ